MIAGVAVGRSGGVVVVLVPEGAVAGADTRGAPLGTRELDLLDPPNLVQRVHAVCVPSGGTRGLAAVDGVVRWLAERHHGFPVGAEPHQVVPLVPAAVVFDGDPSTPDDGYAACSTPVDLGTSTQVGEHTIGGLALPGVGIVVTDAPLTKAECRRIALSAHDGLVRAGHRGPATVFALATGHRGTTSPVDLDRLCSAAADLLDPV
ncbi:P1 family peptidase [Umezawaea endophytica]|uniref:P1 family peptidase n=1 Tax=Umezawaea endophytica TaxID=1654476 RepID=A0A9X2VH55_9PSEU|nr:P1 family peptidase [Umezawaea endophytica]MCS7476034.1 P1 family peptidase [Umezawaea endophytica]